MIKTNVTNAQNKVNGDMSKVSSDQTAVSNAQSAVNTAQNNVNSKQQAVNNAYNDINNPDVQAKQNAVNQAQNAVDTDKNNIQAANTAANQAHNDIDTDKKNIAADQSKVIDDQTAVSNASSANDQAQGALQSAQSQLQNDQSALNNVNDQLSNQNHIVLPSGYNDDMFNNGDISSIMQQGQQLNGYSNQNENSYKHNQADENENIDPHNLTQAQRAEITEWVAGLLNPIREQLGNPLIQISNGSLQYSQDVTNKYNSDNWDWLSQSHDTNGLDSVNTQDGINNWSECIGPLSNEGYPTNMDQLKQNIYDNLLMMLFDDADSNYGHAKSLMGYDAKTSTDRGFDATSTEYLGMSVDNHDGIHFNFVDEANNNFDKTGNYPIPSTTALEQQQTQLQGQVSSDQSAVSSAETQANQTQSALNSAQSQLNNDQAQLQSDQNALNDANSRLNQRSKRINQCFNRITKRSTSLEERPSSLGCRECFHATKISCLQPS